jgi:anti-sigma B factor antagonist
MKVSSRIEGDSCIVTVQAERIDAIVALAFKDAVRRATEKSTDVVILNLEQVQFIDSSGLIGPCIWPG